VATGSPIALTERVIREQLFGEFTLAGHHSAQSHTCLIIDDIQAAASG
jgi:hypothetical protein